MSIADILQLIALVVAINAGFTGIVLFVKFRGDKEYKAVVRKLQIKEQYIRIVSERLVDYTQHVDTNLRILQDQTRRLLQYSNIDPQMVERIFSEFDVQNRASRKRHLELVLIAGDGENRLSAARGLAQLYGDIDTLDIFDSSLLFAQVSEEKAMLSNYKQSLCNRLNGKITSSQD